MRLNSEDKKAVERIKAAAGAIVLASHIDELRRAIDVAYPRSHPDYIAKYAVHVCRVVQGVTEFEGLL